MKRKTRLSFLVILILLSQCSKNSAPPSVTPSTIRVTWEVSNSLSTRESSKCFSPTCFQHATLTMDGLFKLLWKTEDWELQKSLAENFELKKKSLTISLKRNVKWSDGKKLTAEDFLQSWKKILKDCQTLDRFPVWKQVVGVLPYCRGEKKWKDVLVRAPKEDLIEISMDKSTSGRAPDSTSETNLELGPEILRSLAHPHFFPIRATPKNTVLALGPFLLAEDFASADSGHILTYVPNPHFHATPPPIRILTLRNQPRAKSSLAAMLSQQAQLSGPIPETTSMENIDLQNRLLMPGEGRFGVATFVTGQNSSWDLLRGFQWTEPQKLGLPRSLGCSGNRLCALDPPEVESLNPTKPSAPNVALHATDSASRRLAENAAAQWRALTQAHVQWKNEKGETKLPAVTMEFFSYRSNPFTSIYPVFDLWNGCLSIQGETEIGIKAARIVRPPPGSTESEVRRFERKLREPPRCIPLAVKTILFVRDPHLKNLAWTAYGTWDFSQATFPAVSSTR